MTPPLWIGIGLALILGVLDSGRVNRHSHIRHIRDDAVELKQLAIRILPSDGWTYLAVRPSNQEVSPTLVNPSAFLIVRLQPFSYQSWPPTEWFDKASSGPEPTDAEFEVVTRRYKDCQIDWLETDQAQVIGPDLKLGKLICADTSLLVAVKTHSGAEDRQSALRTLCNSISSLSLPSKNSFPLSPETGQSVSPDSPRGH